MKQKRIRIIVITIGIILIFAGIILWAAGGELTGEQELWKGTDRYYLTDVVSNGPMMVGGFFMVIAGGITLYVGVKLKGE